MFLLANICSLAVYSIKYTYNDAYAQYLFISYEFLYTSVMCSNKTEQVAQVYFEIWTVEVSKEVRKKPSVDFDIFVYLFTHLIFFHHLNVIFD